jgi:hypothetical protein
MSAVREVVAALESDGRVDTAICHEFKLRPDFARRKMKRDRAIIACLAPHRGASIELFEEDLGDFKVERFDPSSETAGSEDRRPFFERTPGETAPADSEVPTPETA